MPVSKQTALRISIGAIVLSGILQIVFRHSDVVLPEHFSELVLRIVRNKLIVMTVMFLLLRLEGEGFGALGGSAQAWPKHLGIGVAIGLVMFVLFNVALASAMNAIIPRQPDQSLAAFFRPASNLLAWLPIGIFGGGVVEELQRIFVLTRLEKWLGRPGLMIGLIVSSLMFGFGHLYQGLGIAIATGLSGLVLALVYLRRRSALEPIAAHAVSDVLAMIAATMLAQSH